MTTDAEFETLLRGRLRDLADAESDWDDPAPEARRRAPTPDLADVLPAAPARRRWLPTLAVAAVLLAVVVAGGLGIRELARSGGESASSADAGAGMEASPKNGAPVAGSGSGSSASCADLGPATSTGSLAGNGSLRPGGIVGPRVTSGGTVDIPYVLSFAAAGGTVQVRQPEVFLVQSDRLVATSGTLGSDLAQALPVTPGVAASGSVTFHATDCEGQPLPAGEYDVAVVYPYTVDGAPQAYLVSAPVLAVVS